MMGLSDEPWGYYLTDANGQVMQMESSLYVCMAVPTDVSVCAPLGYGGCDRDDVQIKKYVKNDRKVS